MGRLTDRARERRRVILVLTEDQARAGRRDKRLVDYFDDEEAAVVTLQEAASTDDFLIRQLSSQNRLTAGGLLIQSPYNQMQYEFADSAVTEFAVAKFMLITQVCMLLGAKSVKVDNVIATTRNEQTSLDASAKVVGRSGSLKADLGLGNKVRERLEVSDTFPGGPADIEGARTLLASAGLTGDATLESLINMRSGANRLTRREIKLSLTQESTYNLSVATKFSQLMMVNVSSNFKRQVAENIDVVLQATIIFPA